MDRATNLDSNSLALAEHLMTTVLGLRRALRGRGQAGLPEPPLRGPQVDLLRVVERQPGIGVAAAARALHLAGNSVSTLVNQLVEAGLLERGVDPDDRRAARLELTAVARDRLANWRRARTEVVGGALTTLSIADKTAIADALPAIERLLAVLKEQPL